MRGYLNLFEGECMFIGEKSYAVKKGIKGVLTQDPYKGQPAEIDFADGRWILRGADFEIGRVQGVEMRIEESQFA